MLSVGKDLGICLLVWEAKYFSKLCSFSQAFFTWKRAAIIPSLTHDDLAPHDEYYMSQTSLVVCTLVEAG